MRRSRLAWCWTRRDRSAIVTIAAERAAYDKLDQRYAGRATVTWTIEWEAPALGDACTLTEVRETPFTVSVVVMQA
ncbi:hypothetical protein OG462_44710 [Streptomyces sp. NBC_01077]|uniref:hypothetical protein n=1 Tax=Streptomyces sp. NBC_01077 TaxID=2903746 RepID=UPI00386EB75D|nr:hypothetical protein OG462_00295 [Streptomyces sp. NBC_01077]WSV43787.1 hypothetical protein OG462_44710 [Streptomyces sp. NBC_01077]